MLIWLRYSGEFCRKVALILGLNHITTYGMYIRMFVIWTFGGLVTYMLVSTVYLTSFEETTSPSSH